MIGLCFQRQETLTTDVAPSFRSPPVVFRRESSVLQRPNISFCSLGLAGVRGRAENALYRRFDKTDEQDIFFVEARAAVAGCLQRDDQSGDC